MTEYVQAVLGKVVGSVHCCTTLRGAHPTSRVVILVVSRKESHVFAMRQLFEMLAEMESDLQG